MHLPHYFQHDPHDYIANTLYKNCFVSLMWHWQIIPLGLRNNPWHKVIDPKFSCETQSHFGEYSFFMAGGRLVQLRWGGLYSSIWGHKMKQLDVEVSTPANDSQRCRLKTGKLQWLIGRFAYYEGPEILRSPLQKRVLKFCDPPPPTDSLVPPSRSYWCLPNNDPIRKNKKFRYSGERALHPK